MKPLNPLTIIFTSVYFFAFREATKIAVVWEAFHSMSFLQHRRKFPFSIAVLALLPLGGFALGLSAVRSITIDPTLPHIVRRSIFLVLALVLAGLFPRACKHLWALLVIWHDRKNPTNLWEWQPDTLPFPIYSFQVLFFLGVLPALWLWYWTDNTRVTLPDLQDLQTLWVSVYSAELVVLLHIARQRRFMGVEERPKFIVNSRSWLSIPMLVVLPILFARASLAWMNVASTPGGSLWVRSAVVVGVGFPYCSSSALFFFARKLGWGNEDEVTKGLPDGYFVTWLLVGAGLLLLGMGATWARPDLIRELIHRNSNVLVIPTQQ